MEETDCFYNIQATEAFGEIFTNVVSEQVRHKAKTVQAHEGP